MKYPVNFEITLKKNTSPGLYIALEGIDGCGKTTQIEKLAEHFKDMGREVVLTREPRKSGVIGDIVHKVLLGEVKLPSVSLQYLFSADRAANHHDVVLPALAEGKVVLTDRCFWSAIVYGILDRTGGTYDKSDADLLLMTQSILSMYHQFTVPDYTFYLAIPLEASWKRLKAKDDVKEIYEDKDKIAKVLTGYEYLNERFAEVITKIDGNQPVEKVTEDMVRLLPQR